MRPPNDLPAREERQGWQPPAGLCDGCLHGSICHGRRVHPLGAPVHVRKSYTRCRIARHRAVIAILQRSFRRLKRSTTITSRMGWPHEVKSKFTSGCATKSTLQKTPHATCASMRRECGMTGLRLLGPDGLASQSMTGIRQAMPVPSRPTGTPTGPNGRAPAPVLRSTQGALHIASAGQITPGTRDEVASVADGI